MKYKHNGKDLSDNKPAVCDYVVGPYDRIITFCMSDERLILLFFSETSNDTNKGSQKHFIMNYFIT